MARGAQTKRYKRFYAQIRPSGKNNSYPHLEVKRKEDDNYSILPFEKRDEKNAGYIVYEENNLTGALIKVKVDGYTWKARDKWIDTVELTLRDYQVDEEYVISTTFSNLGRSLVNSLLNIEDGDYREITVSLYKKKDSDFDAISVNKNGEWTGFKHKYEEYKDLVREYEGRDGIEKDWSKVEEFFITKARDILEPAVAAFAKTYKAPPKKKVEEKAPADKGYVEPKTGNELAAEHLPDEDGLFPKSEMDAAKDQDLNDLPF